MHPQVTANTPGSCPICGMDLVQRRAATAADSLPLTAVTARHINLRTAQVRQAPMLINIRSLGIVEFDQRSLHHLHSRVEGWIEAIGPAAVGDQVRAGELLFALYAPTLMNAQEELIQAAIREDTRLLHSARERLRALDVQPEVIARIERERQALRALPWVARQDAVLTESALRHGMFVKPGDQLVALADLSRLWVRAQLLQPQTAWVQLGQAAELQFPHLPGQRFHSQVSHLYPQLDPITRTQSLRLPLANPEQQLRPGMWADIQLQTELPSVLQIPREALIRTGSSTRVVILTGERFSVREVETGLEQGDWVEIRTGLHAGETLVTSGQFLLDSEAALSAGPRRLDAHSGHQH